MPPFFEGYGDNDFASIFPSVAEEKREREERQQTEMLLRVLDELELSSDSIGNHNHRSPMVENMKVSIIDDGNKESTTNPSEALRKSAKAKEQKRHNKVHTLDDLPPMSEFELLFGAQPEPDEIDPPVVVTSGRRLKDGKIIHSARFAGFEDFGFYWSGISFENICFIGLFLLFFLFIIFRVFVSRSRSRRTSTFQEDMIRKNIRSQIEAEVRMQMMGYQQFQPIIHSECTDAM